MGHYGVGQRKTCITQNSTRNVSCSQEGDRDGGRAPGPSTEAELTGGAKACLSMTGRALGRRHRPALPFCARTVFILVQKDRSSTHGTRRGVAPMSPSLRPSSAPRMWRGSPSQVSSSDVAVVPSATSTAVTQPLDGSLSPYYKQQNNTERKGKKRIKQDSNAPAAS